MTESKTSPTPSPDPLDALLADWSSQLECSPEQTAMMWSRVSESLTSDNPLGGEANMTDNSQRPSTFGTIHWGVKLSLAACLLIAIGLGFSALSEPHRAVHSQVTPTMDSLASFAFTPEELLEKQALAIEIQQLCQKSVLIRKSSSGWDIDEVPSLADAVPSPKSAIVIRCLLMEPAISASSPDKAWRVVQEEEVITDAEYQHMPASGQTGDVEAWVHLLPDQTLWTECHDELREEVCVLKQNQPRVVWQDSLSGPSERYLVVVYQCLDLDGA